MDAACEQKILFKVSNIDEKLDIHPVILKASASNEVLKGFFDIKNLNIQRANHVVYGKSSSVAPEFIQMIESKFQKC